MIRARAIFAMGLALAMGTVAHAQPTPTPQQIEQARAHFERGTALYEAGDYPEAQVEFRTAYELSGHPDMLYNLYTAAERNGDLDVAVDALEGYLRDGDVAEASRAPLTTRLGRLRARQAQEESERRASAEREAESAAQLEAERRERAAAERTIDASYESGQQLSDVLSITGIAALIGAGIAAVLFGTFAGLSETEDQALATRCGSQAMRLCREEDVDDLRTYNLTADASWITAAGLGVVGLVLVLIGETTRPSRPSAERAGPIRVGASGLAVTF
ncbi:MAG: hypothetical protein AB7S26_41400 [Sandaracinaceae bacterium]